ncbi:hypothetical protein ACWKWU_13345 [Chitinophaga lutea]
MAFPDRPYRPIDCNYYDRLEAWATMQTPCTLLFLDDDGREAEVSGLIRNLYTVDKAEFLLLDNGLVLRLDQLLAVNGIPLPGVC